MWIIPINYQPSSVSALDMVASKEDLTLQELNIESSLMWRSKPSPVQTWLRRWKRISWLQHLFGRILKPSQHKSFETRLISSLAGIPASRFQQQDSEREQMTPDTSGPLSSGTSKQLDLFDASLKTSMGTSVSDSEKSSKTWKALVTQRRGEYSARLKRARLIRESESTFWPTPTTQDNNQIKGKDKRGTTLGGAVRQWPTPTANSRDATPSWTKTRNGKQAVEPNLAGAVLMWPTPTVGEEKFRLKGTSQASRCLEAKARTGKLDSAPGKLNPDWVEWLMGVPTGWTDLGSWETE